MSITKEERKAVDNLVEAYMQLLEENKQLNARRVSMLEIIEKQRLQIYELKQTIETIQKTNA